MSYIPNTITSIKALTFTANNTTLANPLFRITGSIEVRRIWGVVTTVLSSNVTAAYWRLNDQTAQVDISLAAGTTLSAAAVGGTIIRRPLASTALTYMNAAAGRVQDPPAASANTFTPFALLQKTGAINTDVEFVYTTTNTPSTGVIQFFMEWTPLSADGAVTVL